MRSFALAAGLCALVVSSAVALGAVSPAVDCTASNADCPEIVIVGDRPATLANGEPSPARGYADPSMRKDPASRRIWMAYSWPHTTSAAGRTATAVDTHLSYSDDGGRTWRFDSVLWKSSPTPDPRGGGRGFANSEAVSIEPARTKSGIRWYSARDQYVIGTGGRFRLFTYHLRIAAASSPRALARAPEQVLGGGVGATNSPVDVDLSSLSRELSGCIFRDADLTFVKGELYLAAECSLYTASGEDFAREFVALFSTRATGPVKRWKWRYVGKLAGRREAVELGGDNLLQTELTSARNGKLLAIFSPSADSPTSPLAAHFGCRVVEVASLSPPRLARTPAGALSLLANVTASDLLPDGPAACTYEPASATGIVIVRRRLDGGPPVVSLHRTGLRP